MSLLSRPSVVIAIVFGCFAVLLPRVFIPFFRGKPSSPSSHNFDDHFRRPPSAVSRDEHGDTVHHIHGTPPHMRGAHPNMRMHHPGANNQPPAAPEQGNSKSIVTLALPMYTVGIGVFFIYTCCKYWSKKNSDHDNKVKTKDLPWPNNKKEKLTYDILDKDSEEDEDNKENFYGGLDPDYVEYLKTKKQKALEAEAVMTEEQKQMHYALEEMKKSLSFISSKLITKESRGSLHGHEILQLQERLVSTEAQMCKILTALDGASNKVNKIAKKSKQSPEPIEVHHSEDEVPQDQEEDDSVSSEDETDDKWEQRNRSASFSSNSSVSSDAEEDQSTPIDEQNQLIQRKHR